MLLNIASIPHLFSPSACPPVDEYCWHLSINLKVWACCLLQVTCRQWITIWYHRSWNPCLKNAWLIIRRANCLAVILVWYGKEFCWICLLQHRLHRMDLTGLPWFHYRLALRYLAWWQMYYNVKWCCKPLTCYLTVVTLYLGRLLVACDRSDIMSNFLTWCRTCVSK